jgi:hypothetical protein
MILMGFSFSSGGGMSAHTHSNSSSDGGALSTTATLIGAATLYPLVVALG